MHTGRKTSGVPVRRTRNRRTKSRQSCASSLQLTAMTSGDMSASIHSLPDSLLSAVLGLVGRSAG